MKGKLSLLCNGSCCYFLFPVPALFIMKNLFTFLTLLCSFQLIGQDWTQVGDFPGDARRGAASFVINDIAYVGLGTGGGNYYQDFWQYDDAIDTWTQMADFPGDARAYPVSFILNGKAYVGLGEVPASGPAGVGYMPDMFEFDPSTQSWTMIDNFSGLARSRAATFVIGDLAYICHGMGTNGELDSYYSFDGEQSIYEGDLGTWRSDAVGFSINGKGYVSGGKGFGGIFYTDLREYDPITDEWTEKVSANVAFNHVGAIAYVIDGKAYLGYGSNERLTEYDPANNQYANLGDVMGQDVERTHGTAFVLGNKAYVALGCGAPGLGCSVRNDVWVAEYDIVEPFTAGVGASTVTELACFGDMDGEIFIEASGGQEPYNYFWTPNDLIGNNPTGLGAGVYTVTVTDNGGASEQFEIEITSPSVMEVITDSNPETTPISGDATAFVLSGGTGPFTYLWDTDPPATTSVITGLSAGEYTVTVTDANGCTIEETIVVDFVEDVDEVFAQSIKVAPNIIRNQFSILSGQPIQGLDIKLLDCFGRSVKNWENGMSGAVYQIPGIPHGTYFIAVHKDNKIKVEKVFVRRN